MTRLPEQREVLRLFVALVLILVGAALSLIGAVYHYDRVETLERARLERFHLPTSVLTHDLTDRIAELELTLARGGDAVGRDGSPSAASLENERELSAALYAIEAALGSIGSLQRDHSAPLIRKTTHRGEHHLRRLRQRVEERPRLTRAVEDERAALALTIRQLARLNSITMEEHLDSLARNGKRGARNLSLTALLVLVVAGAVVLRLFRVLRTRLRQHAKTREALAARERQLQQTQKMEALGTLVGGVAHDFNNLLTAILGHAEHLLFELPSDDPHQQSLSEIRKAGERAAGLTRQLLAFSRAETTERRIVQVDLLIRDIEALLRRLIREDIALSIESSGERCRVNADPVHLEQVLINLAINGGDAMPHGGRLVIHSSRVNVGPDDPSAAEIPPGDYCRIRVEDTGLGMSPDVRARIFEPFFTTKAPGRGTGLGLSTVHGIVNQSSGRILVDSRPGEGTTFDVFFPTCVQSDSADRSETVALDALRGTETVLLVEDEAQVRELVATGLRQAGYQVILAVNGEEGLRICRQHPDPIHLVLSDVVMPELRGPELVEQARELHPGVAAIFISGYSEDAILQKVADSGLPLVAKPFKLQRLLEVVRRELDVRLAREMEDDRSAARA